MCISPVKPLVKPTRSFLVSTPGERLAGFAAASVFSVAYPLAPLYLGCAIAVAAFSRELESRFYYAFFAPLVLSSMLPRSLLPKIGHWILTTWPMRQMPKYFEFEEYHEVSDAVMAANAAKGKRYVFCFHPHGVFPFVASCALVSALGAEADEPQTEPPAESAKRRATIIRDFPTAVANVLLYLPILKDIVGLFGVMDASAATIRKRLRTGSCALYVGGMLELFLSSPHREAVALKKRKGFVKIALQCGADLVPTYMFGNTTVLTALTAGPLAALSRKCGVSLTVFWGRFGLPLPKRVKLVYARGAPLGMPLIENPTDADVAHWHGVYCTRLVELFDNYKCANPDYAHKKLFIE